MRKKINKEKVDKGKKYSFKEKLKEKVKDHLKGVDLNYIFTFGKHRGRICREVCANDPRYIRWCMQKNLLDFQKEVIDYMIYFERERKDRQEKERERTEEAHRKREKAQREKERFDRYDRMEERYKKKEEAQRKQENRHRNDEDFWKNRFRQESQAHPSAAQPAQVKIVSPAAQWDHLPEKQKHGKVLGIAGGTQITKQAIRDLYKKRMLEYHPDKCERLGPEVKKLSHEMTIKIQAAYEYFQGAYGI